MDTPFFGGNSQSLAPDLDNNRLVNMYPEVVDTRDGKQVGAFYPIPGERYLAAIGSGTGRGSHVASRLKVLVTVVGNTVYTYDQNAAVTAIGTLNTTDGQVSIISNNTQFCVADGYQAWTWDSTDSTWTQTPLTNPVILVYQDGFGVANQNGTNQVFQSNLNDLKTWDALNFSSADSNPTSLVSAASLFRQLWLFKENATEIWNNAGLSGFVFQRMNGAYLQVGCIAPYSVTLVGDRICWLGQDDEGAVSVYMNRGYSEEKISYYGLDHAIQGYLTQTSVGVSDAVGFCYTMSGHTFYVLTFPSADATWVYDQTMSAQIGYPLWHQRGEFVNGEYQRWDANGYGFLGNKHIVGSASSNRLYYLDPGYPLNDFPGQDGTANPKRWMRRWRALEKHQNDPIRFPTLRIDLARMEASSALPANLSLSGDVPNAYPGQSISGAYTASSGYPPYGSFTVVSGSFPTGLTLASDGTYSGTATAGTYSWTVQASDYYGNTANLADGMTVENYPIILSYNLAWATPYSSPSVLANESFYLNDHGNGSPTGIASPLGTFVFAQSGPASGNNQIYEWSSSSYTLVAITGTAIPSYSNTAPQAPCFSPDEKYFFLGIGGSIYAYKNDGVGFTFVTSFATGQTLYAAACSSDYRVAFSTGGSLVKVYQFDGSTFTLLGSSSGNVSSGQNVKRLDWSSDDLFIAGSNATAGPYVFDPISYPMDTIGAPDSFVANSGFFWGSETGTTRYLYAIGGTSYHNHSYSFDINTKTMTALNTDTNQAGGTSDISSDRTHIVYSGLNNKLYVMSISAGTMTSGPTFGASSIYVAMSSKRSTP